MAVRARIASCCWAGALAERFLHGYDQGPLAEVRGGVRRFIWNAFGCGRAQDVMEIF